MAFETTKRLIFNEAYRLLDKMKEFENINGSMASRNYCIFSNAFNKLSNEYECIFNSDLKKDLEYDKLERMTED